MLSFRKKILISDLVLFLLFFLIIFVWLGNNAAVLRLGIFLLIAYTFMTMIIVFRLSWPIQYIINSITPYQDGKLDYLPRIVFPGVQSDECLKLAATLNSLTEKIRKQIDTLKAQKQETEVILESLGEGVVAVDSSGDITFANQVACKMLSITPSGNLKRTFSKSPLQSKCRDMVLQALQTSDAIHQSWQELTSKGTVFFDLFSSPLSGHNGAILVLQDKTADHKLTEMGKDFIANASHELRTPITILRGFAEMLQHETKLPPAVMRDIGEKIVKTCLRLEKLVKSLLTLADIENLTEEKFYGCDLVAIAENCQNLLLTAHPEVKISFDKQISEAPVFADGDLLDMAIMNLLENGVKYSPSPAEIQMSSRFTSDGYELVIKDLGIGIPEADLPHIFDRFYTVHKARSRKSGGAGLGLSIVKTIIDKHKGKISVSSTLEKGSQFSILLPIKN